MYRFLFCPCDGGIEKRVPLSVKMLLLVSMNGSTNGAVIVTVFAFYLQQRRSHPGERTGRPHAAHQAEHLRRGGSGGGIGGAGQPLSHRLTPSPHPTSHPLPPTARAWRCQEPGVSTIASTTHVAHISPSPSPPKHLQMREGTWLWCGIRHGPYARHHAFLRQYSVCTVECIFRLKYPAPVTVYCGVPALG